MRINIFIIGICILLLVPSVLGFFDSDESFLYIFSGGGGSPANAQFYIANESPVLINIGAINTYYNLTDFQEGIVRNVNLIGNTSFNISSSGTYTVFWQMSITGGASSSYEAVIFVNNIEEHLCESNQRMINSMYSLSMSAECDLNLSVGDIVTLRIKDTNPPAVNIYIDSAQFKVKKYAGVGTYSTVIYQNITNNYNNTVNNSFYYNTTINQTINNTINITLNQCLWFNYTDPIWGEKYAYLNKSYADHISVEHINIEGQLWHDIGQFVIVTPVGQNLTIKRITGLDEVFQFTGYQCRSLYSANCSDLQSHNDTNLTAFNMENYTFDPVPSIRELPQIIPDSVLYHKHYQEQIFYERIPLDFIEPIPAPAINDAVFIYRTTFTYTPRDYRTEPEFQCTCEVSDGLETFQWESEEGGFVVCEARAVTTTKGDAICKIYYSSQSGILPTPPYYVHVSTRGVETDGRATGSDIFIEWNQDTKAE